MKGQLTVEYLFLALVSLSLIFISLNALIKIRETGERIFHLEVFKSSMLDVYNSGEELCAMGSGNSMKLRIKENISIIQDGTKTVFSNQNLNISVSRNTSCTYSNIDILADSEIEIKNKEGEIEIIK